MLEIQDLVKVYPGPVVALQGLQLSIPQGMFGLLGPNGSGKSTLMRIITGLLEPTSGAVLMDGHNVTEKPAYMWQRLGYLPQDFGFYPNLTGEMVLKHMLRLKGVEAPGGLNKLVAALLERVNLSYAARRKVKAYSGGMKQRLGIAQAIAGNPELVIVDEPTAGLDPQERIRFYRLLSELAEERTVLLTTHIVEDVAVLCPQFAVMQHGEVLAQTSPSAACAAIVGTIYEGQADQALLEKLTEAGLVTRAYLVEGRNRLRIHVKNDTVPDGFTPVAPTLEDAYMLIQQGGVS